MTLLSTHLGRVASKRAYIILDPLEGKKLVFETEVESTTGRSFLSLRESEGPKPVVHADIYDWTALYLIC